MLARSLCDFSEDLDRNCQETLNFCDFSGGSGPPVPLPLWIHTYGCSKLTGSAGMTTSTVAFPGVSKLTRGVSIFCPEDFRPSCIPDN